MDDTKHWVAFSLVPGMGRVRFGLLEKHFGSLEAAWGGSLRELGQAGLDRRTLSALEAYRPRISPDQEMERLAQHGVKVRTWNHPAYPSRLKEIPDPPPVLYIKGEFFPEDERAVAVVGTRMPTAYGREVAEQLSTDLARNGITVVSGLARGIDGVAHKAALEAGGRTVAVMACGLDIIYPAEHKALAQLVAHQGALVSDYPLGTRPKSEHFPRRNRIMSGISLGTLVVEAPPGSGALITARLALEQNREVFAVPGSIFSAASYGTHRLIQDGAKLVSTCRDIMEELNLSALGEQVPMPLLVPETDTEALLLQHLSQEPIHVDDLGRQTGLPAAAVSSILTMMELRGLVKHAGSMNYIAAREAKLDYGVN